MKSVLDLIKNENWPFFLKIFFFIFCATFIVFSYYTFNFLYGNHDAPFIARSLSWKAYWGLGRPFSALPIQLTQGFMLPIFTPMLAFAFLSIASILFCRLFDLERKPLFYIPVSLLITLTPYLLGKLYYLVWLESYVGMILIFLSFILLKEKTRFSFPIAVLLLYIALGMYQVFINTIFVTLMFVIIKNTIDNDIIEWLKNNFIIFFAILLAAAIYYLNVKLFHYLGYAGQHYTLEVTTLNELFEKIPQVIRFSWQEFFYTQPPIGKTLKILQFSLVAAAYILSVFAIARKRQYFFRNFLFCH